jgi:hypothetical protein
MVDALEAYAKREQITRSEAIKRLIGESLPRTLYDPRD